MAYDAVLVARRGLGVEELRLASRPFAEAVRWALFAETAAPQLEGARELVATDPPDSLSGAERTEHIAARGRARERVREIEALLYPDGDADV